MEGKATFTLTNAKTGRIERQFTEHNLVTDAMKNILNPPDYAIVTSYSWSSFLSAALPLYKTICGGIMLLGNNIPESAGNIMLPPDFIPIATAGDDYSGANTKRGTLNLNETYATENGYHFTWDFGTDKANGTIKCAALTSRIFGNSGFGCGERSGGLLLNPEGLSLTTLKQQFCSSAGQYICTPESRRHLYYSLQSDGSVRFNLVESINPKSIGINDTASLDARKEPCFSVGVSLPFSVKNAHPTFYDSKKGILYFFLKEIDGTDVYVHCAGVDLSDFSVPEFKTWRLPWDHRNFAAAAYFDGMLYIGQTSGFYMFDSLSVRKTLSESTFNSDGAFYVLNDTLCAASSAGTGLFVRDGQVYTMPSVGFNVLGTSVDFPAPYFPANNVARTIHTTSEYSKNPYLCIAANYLATINNLDQPLEKTSEHTLKITYDITN